MTAIMPAAPIANLPDWVRPWPGDAAPAGDRLTWWSDLATAASKANKPRLANFAAGSALLIGSQVQSRENARLRTRCKTLEQKMIAELSHDAVAEKVVDAVTTHTDARVKSTFAALELRIGQIQATEDAALKRIGELAHRIDELEHALAAAEALPR